MPLKIITQQVEQPIQQPIQWGVDTPAFRRVVNKPERLQAAVKAQERHTESLLRDSGARGTAVGWDDNDNPVVKVYIDSSDSEAGIPETLDGIPVVVEYTGKLYALNIPCSDREGGRCDTGSREDATPVLQATAGEPGPKKGTHGRYRLVCRRGTRMSPLEHSAAGFLLDVTPTRSAMHTFSLTLMTV